ncbi:LLM class flavin-dependent oxidoreductase, partial [Acidisphaera sp. L21]|uniref:LLM class flavin-dependent oxidoreductase n=1 Tax=Acidisphaera sp. L21 TaxID=1641851 RepID=UPI00131AAA52
MRFGNFVFTESRDPARDEAVLDEVVREVQLSEALGFDTVWLSEHHFDGNCAYVDPISFAAALAMATKHIRIGLAVAQMSLHHPIRLAEQLSLIDNLSKGRLIVGLGRGTNYNIYEYQGYGIDPAESQARFEEATKIILQAWTSEEGFAYTGQFWDVNVPVLRPRPFTRPHPFAIRAASGEASMIELGHQGKPFLMNVQSLATTQSRVAAWRDAGRQSHVADADIASALEQSWVWRNIYVAETDAEALRIGLPAFTAMQEHRAAMRQRILREQGSTLVSSDAKPPARIDPTHALICGSPATVAERIAELEATGVGGVILAFRLGPMRYEHAAQSLNLFMNEVVPRSRLSQAA